MNGDFPVYVRMFVSGHFLDSVSPALDCPSRIATVPTHRNDFTAPDSVPHNVVNPKVASKSQCAVFKDENGMDIKLRNKLREIDFVYGLRFSVQT